MKELHRFTISLEREIEKTEEVVRDGQTVKEIRKVKEPVPHVFVLKKPTRSETDSLRLFYGASIKRAVDHKLLTTAVMVNKHVDGAGALLTAETSRRIAELTKSITEIRNEIIHLGKVDTPERSEEQTKLLTRLLDCERELFALESSNQTIYSNSAESYARDRANLYTILFQTYIEQNGKIEPYFRGKEFEDKEQFLEQLEESNNELYLAVAPRLAKYFGYYSSGVISNPEDFIRLDEEEKRESEIDKEVAESAPQQ